MIHALVALATIACPGLVLGQVSDVLGDCTVFLGTDRRGDNYRACIEGDVGEHNAREVTIQRLRDLLEDLPESPWPAQYLGWLHWSSDNEAAAAYYSIAAERFAQLGEFEKAVDAHLNATRLLSFEEALEILERAEAVARAAASLELDAIVRLQRAYLLAQGGRDLERAYGILVDIKAVIMSILDDDPEVEPEDTPITEYEVVSWLDTMGYVTYELGLRRRSMMYRRDMVEALAAWDQRNFWWEASARYNYAIAYRAVYESASDLRNKYLQLMREALTTAVAGTRNYGVEWKSHLELGKLLRGEEGLAHLRGCIDVAEEARDSHGVLLCKRGMAGVIADEDLKAAGELLTESIDLANEAGDLQAAVYGAAERVLIRWRSLPHDVAVSDVLAVLDLIEAYRLLQTTEGGRMGVFSVWSEMYSRIAGLLLGTPEMPPGSADLELAFMLMERGRSRALIDARQSARVASSGTVPAGTEHPAAVRRIVELQQALMDLELSAARRDELTAELHRAETLEVTLRPGSAAASFAGDFAGLEDVQARLAPNEALLAFQLAPWENVYGNFAGGSWVFTVTEDSVRVHRLEGRAGLDSIVPLFIDRASQRNDEYRALAVHIYKKTLEDALRDLPDTIEHLIIAPDGLLHRIPFAALVQDGAAKPLASRYELSIVPSVTLWVGGRDTKRARTSATAFVLADPTLGGDAHAGFVAQIGGGGSAGNRLGSLPYARREGRSVRHHLGHTTHVLEGDMATEEALRGADLEPYPIVHFAAHAVIDEDFPDRSAVYLATASEDSDGLLQRREIVDLPLESKIIVLSGCQSATGAVLRGEGVMSLAHPFFQAGATTVIGSLWPLRDDDAAAVFDSFYEHLAAGMSVARAMQQAQIDQQQAGLPVAAWGGIVVLGDGAVVPFPDGVPGERLGVAMPIAAVAALLALLLAGALYRGRRGHSVRDSLDATR